MTLIEAIAKADSYCPNRIDQKEKIAWISGLDKRLINEVISRYPALECNRAFSGYSETGDDSRELVAAFPYDEMYVHYIAAKIYLIFHEQKHYNNELDVFNSIFGDYKVYLNREYRPGGCKTYRVR